MTSEIHSEGHCTSSYVSILVRKMFTVRIAGPKEADINYGKYLETDLLKGAVHRVCAASGLHQPRTVVI